jgi:NAD(P)-dependent dehydrogenase (short-subunit alcohol dehydrogenase family)
MAGKRVWLITGAGRGMGVDIAHAALAAGHAVVATGRNTEAVADAVGEADDLLVVELDITRLASAEAAVQAALERFGRIDVLVNNAGNFYAGFFEELTPDQVEGSLTTNLVGPMNVTRAVLPVMRKQRSGNVVTITSTAGIVGQEFCSAYASAKLMIVPPGTLALAAAVTLLSASPVSGVSSLRCGPQGRCALGAAAGPGPSPSR